MWIVRILDGQILQMGGQLIPLDSVYGSSENPNETEGKIHPHEIFLTELLVKESERIQEGTNLFGILALTDRA